MVLRHRFGLLGRLALGVSVFSLGCDAVPLDSVEPELARVDPAPLSSTFVMPTAEEVADLRSWRDEETPVPATELIDGDLRPWLTSSRIALTIDEARVAVPDAETDRVVVFDADTLERLGDVKIQGQPEELLTLPDGQIAVACRGGSQVAIVDPVSLRVTHWIPTGAAPRGMALTPDGKTLFVASFAEARVDAFNLEDGEPLWSTRVEASPLAVAVDSAGKGIFVTHLRGRELTELSPATGKIVRQRPLRGEKDRTPSMARALVPLSNGRMMVPYALASTGSRDPKRIVTSGTYGGSSVDFEVDTTPLVTTGVLMIDARCGRDCDSAATIKRPGYRVVAGTSLDSPASVVAAARHKDGAVVLVDQAAGQLALVDGVAFGEDSLHVDVLPTDAGPGAAVFTRNGESLFVVSWVNRGLTRLDTHDMRNDALRQASAQRASYAEEARGKILPSLVEGAGVLVEPPPSATPAIDTSNDLEVGRRLFHTLDASTSTLGVTCASCHPDGLDDGRTWVQGVGPRQTPSLAGRVGGTGPFNWLGSETTLEANLAKTIHRLNGQGLTEDQTRALATYIQEGLPKDGVVLATRQLDAKSRRGKDLFMSEEVGCATCHDPAQGFTDGLRHDIGSTSALEKELFAAQRQARVPEGFDRVPSTRIAFDTPSLGGVGQTAPYFHDGRARTLREVLTTYNEGDTMGKTSHLAPEDLDALVAYLETL